MRRARSSSGRALPTRATRAQGGRGRGLSGHAWRRSNLERMELLATALEDAGGTAAPRERTARLRALLRDELARSEGELALPRSGREQPVSSSSRPRPTR